MKNTYTTPPSTIYRIFEIHEKAQYNESGEKPVFVKPVEIEGKKRQKN